VRRHLLIIQLAVVFLAALSVNPSGAPSRAAGGRYAIRDARLVTVSGAVVDKGTILVHDGLIEDVGPSVTVPADAVVIDGAGLSVYPGFIDMANWSVVDVPDAEPAAGRAAGAGGGGAGGGGAAPTPTLEDLERSRRVALLRPDVETARYARFEGAPMRRIASAGITSVLAVPYSGLIRGQSALINVMAPPSEPHISAIADYRRGLVVVKSPVAQHFAFAGAGARGGGGYPGGLLGTIAFVRQALYDAKWQQEARAFADRHADRPRPVMEPMLDALAPVLSGRLPAAFEANLVVEIARALALSKEFGLDPIIVGGTEAADAAADLKAARARVIYSLNFPTPPEAGRGGRAGGRGGAVEPVDESMRTIRARQNAPKAPAALLKAGVPFAFTSAGLEDLSLFMRNAARTVKDGSLPPEAALAALTLEAARIAGVDNRLGTLQKGKIANLVVTDGDWLEEKTRIRHVFIDGRPVDLDPAPATPPAGGRGRGQ